MAKKTTKTGPKKTTKKAAAKKPATSKKATAQRSKPIAQSKAKPKAAAKKAAAKKPAAKKAAAKAKPSSTLKKLAAAKPIAPLATRRPSPSPLIPMIEIASLTEHLNIIKAALEDFAAHLRALDRARINGVGIRRQGFIERAYQLAVDNQEFLPHWLPMAKFRDDHEHFVALRSLIDIARQIKELVWNLIMQAADMAYTDALEFYDSVSSAAKRRIDAAESIHSELKPFFEALGRRPGDVTEDGSEDGEGGTRKAKKGKGKAKGKTAEIDETFTEEVEFKKIDEREVKDSK